MDGVVSNKQDGYAIFHILKFSEEMKKLIRQQLSSICYGASNARSSRKTYNYNSTIKEFIKRYNSKNENIQKGMIGELLIHILLNEFFPNFETVTPFFNLEERSVKKGFDVVLTDKVEKSIWITEVKSGEIHKDKNANETTMDLLEKAKIDLFTRLNDDENQSLWLNAINGAKIAYDSHNDLKDAVIDILEKCADDSQDGNINSNDINVFLASVLFSSLDDLIEEKAVRGKCDRIKNQKKFRCIFVLAIQKATYIKVYEFLEKEAER